MSPDYRLSIEKDQPIVFSLAYRTGSGDPIDLTGKAAFLHYSGGGKPETGQVDGNVIRFNVPIKRSKFTLGSRYEVVLKDLETGDSEIVIAGPLVVETNDSRI